MSSKYFRDWKSSKKSKSESSHLDILKKLDDDNARLDRALDKLDTEEKAKEIFRRPQNPTSIPTQIYSQIGFVNSHSSQSRSQAQAHPVHLVHIGQNMILVNGCVLMRPENFF